MEIHNGTKYENNFARAAACFLGTRGKRPEQVQRQAAFDFLTNLYTLIATKPEELGFNPSQDIWFKPWEQRNLRQNDVKIIRTTLDKVEKIIKELFTISIESEVNEKGFQLPENFKIKKVLGKALTELGLAFDKEQLYIPQDLAGGLKELAEISKAHVIPITDSPIEDKDYFYFSHCVFEPNSDWLIEDLDEMIQANGQLIWLCQELLKRNYQRLDCKDGKRISLDLVKPIGKEQEPVKMSWADKYHLGIEVTYEDLRLEPYFIWLRVPEFKTVLEKAGELPENVRTFITENNKTCNACRYCVQTDKTGKRPLAAITVDGKKQCPYFPSFSMNWRTLDHELAQQIINLCDALDRQ